MKRGKKLIVLLTALLVVLGLTLAVTLMNPKESEKGDSHITVFSLDPEKVTKIWWDYSDEAGFTKTDGKWVYDGDAAFPVNEACLEEMLRILSSVGATKTIENVEDLDQYGLLYPVCAVKVTVDGKEYELAIGDQNNISGDRYFSKGDGNVYMVANEIANYFAFGPEGALAMEEIPDLTGIIGLKLQSAEQNYEIRYETGSDKTYSTHYHWFMDDKVLDTELTEALLKVLQELEWKECADYNATDLAAYGLDAPKAVATATYLDKTFTLELGNKCDKGVYARIAGSNMVYIVKNEVLDKLLYTTYSELMPDEVLAMAWDTVTAMDITVGGTTYTLKQEEIADENGCATGTYAWKWNGTEVEAAKITDALDKMASNSYATGLTPELVEEVRFLFHRNASHHTQVELVLYRYDSNSCLATLDGVSTVLAKRSDVTALINAINKIVAQ